MPSRSPRAGASPDHAPAHATPYASLTPDAVLDALASVGLYGDGRLLQLNSYENRVFQVHLDDGRVVVAKFYREGRWSDAQILEEHAFALELAEADVPAVAPLVLTADIDARGAPCARVSGTPPTLGQFDVAPREGEPSEAADAAALLRFGVTPRMGGRAPELEDPAVLAWIGRFLARLHAVGERRPFEHRPTLSVAHTGRAARDWLIAHDVIPPAERPVWQAAADAALDLAQQAFDRVPDLRSLRLHGDCHVGNLLWTDGGPHFVDLDDACTGPAVQDLWMLLSSEPAQRQAQTAALLDGYEALREFDPRELRLIEPLRTLRLIHHSAWLARRWADPAFPVAFPWFAGAAYWSQQAQQLREQIEAMRDAGEAQTWW